MLVEAKTKACGPGGGKLSEKPQPSAPATSEPPNTTEKAARRPMALLTCPQGGSGERHWTKFVDKPTYFPPEVQANPRFQQRLQREAQLGRLVGAREGAEFAAYLASDAAKCFVG